MMLINAGDLGTVEIKEEEIINFEKGLIGLHELKRFVILKGDDHGVFYWLQSVDDESKRFVIMNVSRFIGGYAPLAGAEHIAELGDYADAEQLEIYNVTVIPEEFLDMTVNLKAPIVLNMAEKKGFQFVSDDEKYPIKYYIQRELQKAGKGE